MTYFNYIHIRKICSVSVVSKTIQKQNAKSLSQQLSKSKKTSSNVIEDVIANLEGQDFTKENELIAAILEKGYSLEQVAAGLLRMNIGQSTKEYAHIEEVTSNTKSKGMRKNEVRLFVNVGSKQKVKAKDFVGMLTKKSDIPARAIGDIDVYKKFSFINVDKAHAMQLSVN